MEHIENGAEEGDVMDGDLAELLQAVEAQIADVSREEVVSSLEDEAALGAADIAQRVGALEVTLPEGWDEEPEASIDSFVG